jgi:hypothetical protein
MEEGEMYEAINKKFDELINDLNSCKIHSGQNLKEKLLDLDSDLESFKNKVCKMQKWIKSGLHFYCEMESQLGEFSDDSRNIKSTE